MKARKYSSSIPYFYCFFMFCSLSFYSSPVFVFSQESFDLTNCHNLEQHLDEIIYEVTHRKFTSTTDFKTAKRYYLYIANLMESKYFDTCQAALDVWRYCGKMADLCDGVLKNGVTMEESKYPLIFVFDDDISKADKNGVMYRIKEEYKRVLSYFKYGFHFTLKYNYVIFFISKDRKYFEDAELDIGGIALGSFVWIPMEYLTIDTNKKLPVGVIRSTLRHEIVHALTNQYISFKKHTTLPKEFIEGMAIYLAGNRVLEKRGYYDYWKLSKEYIRYHHLFKYLNETFGTKQVIRFIGRVLRNESTDYYEELYALTGISHDDLLKKSYTKTEWMAVFSGIPRILKFVLIIVISLPFFLLFFKFIEFLRSRIEEAEAKSIDEQYKGNDWYP